MCSVLSLFSDSLRTITTGLKIFNANSATLLETLKTGIAGYSGIVANIHPEYYRWLIQNFTGHSEQAELLQNFLGFSSVLEKQLYPVNVKYFLQLDELSLNINSRSVDAAAFTAAERLVIDQFYAVNQEYKKRLLGLV